MSKEVGEFVAGNRREAKRINSTLIELNGNRPRNFTFSQNRFQFTLSVSFERRFLNDTLISGHPNPKHGAGRGRGGDRRGDWQSIPVEEVEEAFNVNGRRKVVDALSASVDTAVRVGKIGDGSTPPRPSDTGLESETATKAGWSTPGSQSNVSRFTTEFGFSDVLRPSEFGVFSGQNEMYGRLTFEPFDSGPEEELRANVDFTVTGQAPGDSVITDDGEQVVAESIRSDRTALGLQDYTFGSGTGSVSPSDTSVDSPEFENIAEQTVGSQQIQLHAVVFQQSPPSQPVDVSQIGVLTDTDVLIWLTNVDTFEKSENNSITVRATFQIR